jgi:phage shock protein PspC (stress-responsive transcriptional regulator)
MRKLYRSEKKKIFLGICGGLGEYFRIDPTIIRLLMIFIAIFTAVIPLVLAYLIAGLVIPIAKPSYESQIKYKHFYRSKDNRKIAGICGGLAKLLKVDATIVRLVVVFLCFITGILPMLIAYIIGWMIIPELPYDSYIDLEK